ncbi:MAG: hypothetical protein ABMB14_28315 [Myxococcota bacterium]
MDERVEIDALTLTVEHHPFTVGVGLAPVVAYLGYASGQLGPTALGLAAAVGLALAAVAIRRPATVRISAAGIEVRGWLGRLPWLRTARLGLVGADARVEPSAILGEYGFWTLRLSDARRRVRIVALFGPEEAQAIIAHVQEAVVNAHDRRGAGLDEVPEALRALGSIRADRVPDR